MTTFNENHIQSINSGKVVCGVETMQFSNVPMFKAFIHRDLELNKFIAIVTYNGLASFENQYAAIWNGQAGIDYFLFTKSADAIAKMNEIANG